MPPSVKAPLCSGPLSRCHPIEWWHKKSADKCPQSILFSFFSFPILFLFFFIFFFLQYISRKKFNNILLCLQKFTTLLRVLFVVRIGKTNKQPCCRFLYNKSSSIEFSECIAACMNAAGNVKDIQFKTKHYDSNHGFAFKTMELKLNFTVRKLNFKISKINIKLHDLQWKGKINNIFCFHLFSKKYES